LSWLQSSQAVPLLQSCSVWAAKPCCAMCSGPDVSEVHGKHTSHIYACCHCIDEMLGPSRFIWALLALDVRRVSANFWHYNIGQKLHWNSWKKPQLACPHHSCSASVCCPNCASSWHSMLSPVHSACFQQLLARALAHSTAQQATRNYG
jgi:hypothetical protein